MFNLSSRNVPLGASTRTLSRKFMKNSFPTAVSTEYIIIAFHINAGLLLLWGGWWFIMIVREGYILVPHQHENGLEFTLFVDLFHNAHDPFYKKLASYEECCSIFSIETSIMEIASIFIFFLHLPLCSLNPICEYWLWILPDVTRYAHHVFKAFDVTGTGSISFKVN